MPATAAYADRIREIAAEGWLPGIIAHHYTRYLGDLSGGQMIAKRVKKQFGFERAGIAFYDFTELGDLGEFKKGDMVAPFDKAVFSAELLQPVGPVRTRFGYHVIKVLYRS